MISDNDLLLYYYRDGLDAAERARIGAALGEQPELAARLHRLVARLDAAAAMHEVPVPEAVQQRWQAALESAARGAATTDEQPRTQMFASPSWRMVAAACAIVLLLVTAKLTMQSAPDRVARDVSPAQPQATASTTDLSAYERGLRLHLERTEQQLASLDSSTGEERLRLVRTIIAQNRLYAIAAERADEPQLARVLRAFEPILDQLAADPNDDTSGEIEQLSFELQIMQARLNAAAANRSTAQPVAL